MKNERKTEQLFEKLLKEMMYKDKKNILIHRQKVDEDSLFYKVFDKASKKQNGEKGYPEFFIELKEYDINIVVECKYDPKRHNSPDLSKPIDYAVDGAIWYSKFVKEVSKKTIAIGVSGYDTNTLNIDSYLYEGKKLIKIINNEKNIMEPIDYYKIFENLNKNKKIEDFQKIASTLHKKLHDANSLASENSLIISSILIALNNNDFRNSYRAISNQKNLASTLLRSLKTELEDKGVKKDKINSFITRVKFLESHVILREKQNNLRFFIDCLKEKVYKYMKRELHDIYIDEIGYFYSEFLKYTGSGDGKGLGIILTPYHICELFVEIAEVNKKSKVIDITAGTGGFLVASLSKMLSLNPNQVERKEIKENNLIGFENKSNIYSLLLSNMIVRNDGKSNAINESCFDWNVKDINNKYNPNVGMINPPYSIKIKEWEFVNHMLNCLEPRGVGIAIIPTSICWNNENLKWRRRILDKHSLIGSFAMKHDLFPNAGINVNILVFKAHNKHKDNNKIYFSQWHNDGLERKKGQLVWVDKNNIWEDIKRKWVRDFHNREENNFAKMSKISKHNLSMKPEDYLENNFNNFSYDSINKKALSYVNIMAKNHKLKINDNFMKENIELNLKSKDFKKIKLEIIFNIVKGKSIDKNLRVNGNVAYIGASMNNNGISEKIKPIEGFQVIKGKTLTIGSQGQTGAGTTFYQPFEYIASGTSIALIPKFHINDKIGVYLSALIETYKFLFNFGNKVSKDILNKMEIPLPILGNEINWKKIDKYMNGTKFGQYFNND